MATLTKENWRQLTQEAIRELPADLREFVIDQEESERVTITCGGNPDIDQQLELTYWPSGHEKRSHEQQTRKPDDYINPYEEELLDAHDGLLRKQLDWPLISLEVLHFETSLYVGRVDDAEFIARRVAEGMTRQDLERLARDQHEVLTAVFDPTGSRG